VITAARNLGMKALRRLGRAHKPVVRLLRQRERAQEQAAFVREARRVEQQIARVTAGRRPIIAGPWLAEVGYEALYWVPFLRWFRDAHRIPPERLVIVSRGGVRDWYEGIGGSYIELFDHFTPSELAVRNEARQRDLEAGGRKQTGFGALDDDIIRRVRERLGMGEAAVCHPSLMFRLFRHVWHGTLPYDWLWTHTDYEMMRAPALPALAGLPEAFVAVKFYSGTALPGGAETRDLLRTLAARAAEAHPLVLLDTGLAVDDHDDVTFAGLPNVISAREWMQPSNNLGVQSALIARARYFLGTCGGLAWLAPFFGTPALAVYADDRQLAPHLYVQRQAGRRVGAAEFTPIDLRAWARLGAFNGR